jgi:hypothetical protein
MAQEHRRLRGQQDQFGGNVVIERNQPEFIATGDHPPPGKVHDDSCNRTIDVLDPRVTPSPVGGQDQLRIGVKGRIQPEFGTEPVTMIQPTIEENLESTILACGRAEAGMRGDVQVVLSEC